MNKTLRINKKYIRYAWRQYNYAFLFFFFFAFFTTPPLIKHLFFFKASTISGVILHFCFLGKEISKAFNEDNSAMVSGICFSFGHFRSDNSFKFLKIQKLETKLHIEKCKNLKCPAVDGIMDSFLLLLKYNSVKLLQLPISSGTRLMLFDAKDIFCISKIQGNNLSIHKNHLAIQN